MNLSHDLRFNLEVIDNLLFKCPDVVKKIIPFKNNDSGALFYIEGLINTDILQRDFITNLINMNSYEFESIDELKLPVANISTVEDIDLIILEVLKGKVVLLVDKKTKAFSIDFKLVEKRAISEPVAEKSLKGSHEGFIEVLDVNISIIRRLLISKNLKFEKLIIEGESHYTVVIAYLDNVVNKEALITAISKIKQIDGSNYISPGYIEQKIANKNSLFPLFLSTEKPDKAISSLLEGKIAIFVDGAPNCIVAPTSFFSFFQASDDYSKSWIGGTFFRILRFLGFFIALFSPALYIAITTFQYYVIPLSLLIPLAESRARVPFPPLVEALIMEITIELLREASIRLPTYISSTLGVAGGLVIGQAAVEAGLVSTLFVIVVAITAIAANVIVSHDMSLAVRVIRFFLIVVAALLGYLGLVLSIAIIFAYLLTLNSLGEFYLSPIIPWKRGGLKDSIIRRWFKKVGEKE